MVAYKFDRTYDTCKRTYKQYRGFTASDLYLYVIQLGAILAVVTLYFHKLNPFSPKKTNVEKENTWKMWFKVIIACVPAAVIGLVLDNFMSAGKLAGRFGDAYFVRCSVHSC